MRNRQYNVLMVNKQRGVVKGAVGRPAGHDAVVAHRPRQRLDPRPVPGRGGEIETGIPDS